MFKCCRNFCESLSEERVMSKKEFLLIVSVGVLAGIVFGFLFSPRKTMIMGSYNNDNRGANFGPDDCCDDDSEE